MNGTNDFETADSPADPARGGSALWVVGIGASAGGLESLERFFANVPVDSGLAFVVIQHLSPDFKSVMDELLARQTALHIRHAQEGLAIEPNTIYLIPPRKEAILSGHRFHLTDKDPKEPLSLPIDHFFRSLGADAGPRAVAVVLSGSGSDGSRGIRDVHQAGGLVLCESEETAKFDGMPSSARDTGIVDYVLPPEEMPAALLAHTSRAPQLLAPGASEPPLDKSTEDIFRLLNNEYGIDFSHYKSTTVGRRIERRLAIRQFDDVDQYAAYLAGDPAELNSLYKDLLIGVTRFFRDAEAFEKLERDIIPEIIEHAEPGREIRVWVAGCATGEEAYSIAMLFHERLERLHKQSTVKVFATDVHKASLDFASAAVYSEEAVKQVNSQRLARYFARSKEGYHVDAELRKLIVFAPHNVLKDAPFTKLDLIACRNLLIYFQPLAQKKALSLFHFGLRTGGVLMLGPSESPGELLDEFETLDEHWKVFRKRRDIRLSADLRYPLPRAGALALKNAPRSLAAPPLRGFPDPALLGAYDELLSQHMPPALLIDDRNELLHVFGGAEKHLKLRAGRPSNDALELLEGDLRAAVYGALQRAKKEPGPACYNGVRLAGQDSETCNVVVQRIANPRAARLQFLIKFQPVVQSPSPPASKPDSDHRQISRDRIDTLENELRHAEENLQATVEELETSNEELQATNEELVASNEELQSTNEELHSVNEELYTVNAEYQKKIKDLTEITNDLDSLMQSTDVATIFLGRDLRIRKFTPQIAPLFNLVPHDIGRCIDSFAHHLRRDNLLSEIRGVLETGRPVEADVQDRQNKWKYLRILPYRTKKQIDGVVITLIDIDPLKRTQESLAAAVKQRETFLATLSHELRNPLGALLNATHLLDRNDRDRETVAAALGVVRRQASYIARLLDDLLDISRITQGKFELRRQQFDLRTAVESAIETMRPAIAESGHRLKVAIGDQPLLVDGDPVRLRQVQVNLLDNAIKYSPPTSEICIQAHCERDDAVIRVSDCGEGLSPEAIQRIFEPFFQAAPAKRHRLGGMGLGLALVRLIVEQHRGEVQVRSDGLNQGSEFTVRIPLALFPQSTAEDRQPPAAPRRHRHNGDAQNRIRKIVLVEDQDDNRDMLARWLELHGHHVKHAADGQAGIALIEHEKPEVAIVDIGLPKIDGFEVARRLRAANSVPSLRLIALTGYGQPADIQAARQAGFDLHLVKPVNLDELTRILS
jgi:two-component system CheB/CheR fusion protein